MPTLNKRQLEPEGDQSEWFIVTSGPNHPFTFQLEPEGYEWLLAAELGHKSDIDWDVFETLRSLDLLYTLDSTYAPKDAPAPDGLSFEEIPFEERVQLAEGLLAKFSTTELSAREGTFQFLLSFGNLEWEHQEPVLEMILSGSPFDAPVISDYGEAFKEYGYFYDTPPNYNPILLALVISVVYESIEPFDDIEGISEGNPIWTYDRWVVCAGSELIFYEISETVSEALPDQLFSEIYDAANSVQRKEHFYPFFEQEIAALSEFQAIQSIQDVNARLGKIVSNGLDAEYPYYILILPGTNAQAKGPFKSPE